DHSDGIWNESQATVLQADSGTDNGTALSTSDMASFSATSPVSVKLLTPSSRRKHLLMLQHQQRSSIDTEALDEEFVDQLQVGGSPSIAHLDLETPSISVKGPEQPSGSRHYLQLSAKRAAAAAAAAAATSATASSSSATTTTSRPSSESPLPAVVPDIILARTDSGKTNTDVSESTTTDDYITANSTDSSRRSTSLRGSDKGRSRAAIPSTSAATTTAAPDGSSFESASSIYSLTKADFLTDDMVVPSFSPPPIPEEASELTPTPVPDVVRTGRSSPTGSSSSSGSYSLNGSCPELPQRPPVPSPKKVPSVSEDDRSALCSSSGYYDSPLEDDATWKSSRSDRKDWTEEEITRRKKQYTLEVTKQQEETEKPRSSFSKPSPSKELLKPNDKPKQRRIRTRSPMQPHRKIPQKKSPLHKSPEVQQMEWESRTEERKPLTSDDSVNYDKLSPRKGKKMREKGRKSPRSPTGGKGRRRSGSIDDKPMTFPRKKTIQRSIAQDDTQSLHSHKSPDVSPTKPKCSDVAKLKALSAESLRSVSPGSDSVFYSDPSSHAAIPSDQHVHCLHCGKEVDIVTTDDLEKSSSQPDIVQPPAGFADSPRTKHPPGRLFKKFEKRYRSEDRGHGDRRHHRYRPDNLRAKSEERGAKVENGKSKLRPMARSRDASLEGLRATDSSPSVLPAAPDDEDDLGLYNTPYIDSNWIYIDDHDELQTWSRPASADEEMHRRESISSAESTESEHDFKKRYQAVTHRMVHRKSCLEMYKRQASKSFGEFID
ncbi:PREDICTED: serine/arginine repetitive matrix protein 1-like, partial [Nicrophorus vespilloides]|uniref:Serine/arginine repetitive matrix protein 1-like n=1 Tax=Nicrophorus vespilloides TaxID=110193 RepID=A0ABM1N3W8_NICVS